MKAAADHFIVTAQKMEQTTERILPCLMAETNAMRGKMDCNQERRETEMDAPPSKDGRRSRTDISLD
jgi:hypothetical protein